MPSPVTSPRGPFVEERDFGDSSSSIRTLSPAYPLKWACGPVRLSCIISIHSPKPSKNQVVVFRGSWTLVIGERSLGSRELFFSDLFILQICPRRMIHWILIKVYNNTEKIIFVIPFQKIGVLFCFSGNVNLIYEKNIICHNSGLFFKAFCMGTFLPVFEGFELRIK